MSEKARPGKHLVPELEHMRREPFEAAAPHAAQLDLAESEAKYRCLFENSLDAIFLATPDGTVAEANPAACSMFAMTRDEICLAGRQGLIDPSDERHDLAFEERIRTGGVHRELSYVRKDGTKFVAETGFVLLEGGEKTFVILRDVTERKLAEEVLRESEEKYRSFFENSFDAVFLTIPDNGGVIRAANAEACRMFGYTEEEFRKIGRNGIVDTTDPRCVLFLEERASTGKARGELIHIRKDGTRFPADVSSTIYRDQNGRNLCITVIRDISERKRGEQALQKSEQMYRSLFEHMLDGFAYCGMLFEDNRPVDFELLAVNRALEELTGLTNVVGRKVSEIVPGIRQSNPELIEIFGRVASTGRPERFTTYVAGLGIWFVISVYSPERGSFVAILDDITDRKKAEDALRSANQELERRVEERTLELRAKTTNLEEVNTALRVLLERREEDRKDLEEAIAGNLKRLVLPYAEKLQKTQLSPDQATYLSILQSHLREIESRFVRKLSLHHMGLTPTEMQVAVLIRDAKSTKEIAGILHVSEKAVEFHRNNLRRKLNIRNKKENLRSHLAALS